MLITTVARRTVAEQFRATLFPTSSSNVVPENMRSLQLVSEPRLDLGVSFAGDTVAGSATAWYLAASPSQGDTIELAHLEGQDGPFIETRTGFDIDGIEIKVRQDLAAKAIDHRGLYKNPGA